MNRAVSEIFDTTMETLTEEEIRELIKQLQSEAGYLHCKRCGHDWLSRKLVEPKVCPKCGSRYWNKEYQRPDLVGKDTC